ncbi:DUF5819 family protein [Desmospora profundinema]|uniref:Uncharacterized protein n=1 Tax=Desmospora profundinema TaxID=1571184 RepID=A0ABU1ILW9_9BACL|nr:DUF5819 family protein [Desmospora profundinema]MDR6225781.1 hypothetical protein [Desmospora profundinema]
MDIQRTLFRTVATLAITLLAVHFGLVTLSLTPDNPVNHRHKEAIDAYMDPLFTQNWMLFAPNPVSQHRSLAAQARVVNPRTGAMMETEWVDITDPLVKQKQRNRLSSEALVSRHIISGIRNYRHKDESRHLDGEKMLQRVSSTALAKQWPNRNIHEIRFRIITQAVPSFDQRHRDDDFMQREFQDSDWLPFAPAEEEWPL